MRVDIHWRGDRAMAPLKIKEFILEWLIQHGTSDVNIKDLMLVKDVNYHIMFHFCCDTGLLDSVVDPFTKNNYVLLSKKGLKYVSMQ